MPDDDYTPVSFSRDGETQVAWTRGEYFELAAGQSLRVDTGCLVALQPSVHYDIQFVGGIKTAAPASDAEAGNVWMTEAYELIRCRAKAKSPALHSRCASAGSPSRPARPVS